MFIKSFVNGKYNTLKQLMGHGSSKTGYKGSQYEDTIKNIKTNIEYKLY